MSNRYPQIVKLAASSPWAILPEKLAAILELISLRAGGGRFSAEDIEARIGSPAPARQRERVGTVAVLPLYGTIIPRANLMSEMSGGTSLQQWGAAFQAAVDDPEVGAILMDVDSPGGLTDGVPEMAAQIREARGSKPIVAIANTDAASAAYWLASQADEVVMTPSGMVGSIGVFAAHEDVSGQQEQDGVRTTLISAGKFKTEASPFEPLTEEARAAIQDRVDAFYSMFVADVAKGRGVPASSVTGGFGEGRVVTAAQAMKMGMVDRVAGFEATVEGLIVRAANASTSQQLVVGTTPLRYTASSTAEPPDPPPPPDDPDPTPDDTTEAAHSGLSFVASAYAVRDAADKLVNDARSLNGARREGRFTAAKREGLQAAADALTASSSALVELIAETAPPALVADGADVLFAAHMRSVERRHFPTTGAAQR